MPESCIPTPSLRHPSISSRHCHCSDLLAAACDLVGTMNIAIRIAAAILSVPPDVLAPMVPMMAPPPQNSLEFDLRNEVDSVLSGSCCRSSADGAPLFAISREESNYVNCNSGLPSINGGLFESENSDDESSSSDPSTYGEITSLGMWYYIANACNGIVLMYWNRT